MIFAGLMSSGGGRLRDEPKEAVSKRNHIIRYAGNAVKSLVA